MQERHKNCLDLTNKNSFFNNHTIDIFLFVTALILFMVMSIAMYIICRHTKLKSLVTSLALQQIREADVVSVRQYNLLFVLRALFSR